MTRTRPLARRLVLMAATVAVLAGCSSDPEQETPAAATSSAAPSAGSTTAAAGATSPAATSPAAEDTDAVQTDAPATEASVRLTFVEWAPDSGAIEASAFVQGLVEAGGTCVLVATDGDRELTGDPQPAEPGPSTTDCGGLSVPVEDSGTWRVSVTYSSPATDLRSADAEVEVP